MNPKRVSLVRQFESWEVVNGGLNRVDNLIAIYDLVSKSVPTKRETPPSDILRAAVVLLHAVLEDYVRHVGEKGLPHAEAKYLDEIPLPGNLRGSRFELGQLSGFRGQTVDDVIRESVRDHLSKTSFSSINQIMAILKAAGVRTTSLSPQARMLEGLIRRRHEIVHRADQVRRKRGTNSWVPSALTRAQVVRWAGAVQTFVNKVDAARTH